MKKTTLEQIADLEATRAAKAARMSTIMQKAADEGRTTDQAEAEEFETLDTEVKAADDELTRLRRLADIMKAGAQPVQGGSQLEATQSRGAAGTQQAPAVIRRMEKDEAFKGQNFTRWVIARALGRLQSESPVAIAQQRWGKSNPRLVEVIRAGEVPGGGSGSGEWGAELVTPQNYMGDFIEYLHGMTVFDKLGLREIPANVTVKGQDGTATATWVGQSKGIPVTTADFFNVTLTPLKVAAIAVVSNELLKDSSPAAEALVRDALAEASAQRIDTTFLSTAAAVAGVSPAGILNGLTGITASGTTAADLRADILSAYAPFLAAKNASGLVMVTNSSLAKAISLMMNALGQPEFNGMSAAGGTVAGDRVVTGDNVGSGHVILLKPSDIYRIGDSGLDVRISDVATIEQNTTPTGATDTPAAATATITSMYQEDSTAIRVIRRINFAKRRASAVSFITAAAYAP
jgi:HK97 family phage major capsid protein